MAASDRARRDDLGSTGLAPIFARGGEISSTDQLICSPPCCWVRPTAAPSLSPTASPTVPYTYPPVPALIHDPDPPASSTASWTPLGSPSPIDGAAGGDQFGNAVAMSYDGTVLAASAKANDEGGERAGHVRVYRLYDLDLNLDGQVIGTQTSWVQLGGAIPGAEPGDSAGSSLALSGDGTTVAIGSPKAGSSSGHVRVFRYNETSSEWVQLGADIDGSSAAPNDELGTAVAIDQDGGRVAVGAPGHDLVSADPLGKTVFDAGQVRVFEYDASSGDWIPLGGPIVGAGPKDEAGSSVSLSAGGTRVAVGSPGSDEGSPNAGSVRVLDYDGSIDDWVQIGPSLLGERPYDRAGIAVSLSPDGLRVAASSVNSASLDGSVHVYRNAGYRWERLGQRALVGEADGDEAGTSVALSFTGDRVIFSSSSGKHDNGRGYAQIYAFAEDPSEEEGGGGAGGGSWEQVGDTLRGDADMDLFGSSVAISANGYRIVVGIELADVFADGDFAGQVEAYEY